MRKIARKLYRAIPFKQPVFEVLRRHLVLPERLYRHLHFHGVITVPVDDTAFRMRHHGTQIENEVFWSGLYGRWEGASLRLWVRAARRARVVLDVGANSGLYALAAQAVAPHARVFAIEPVERIRRKLQDNVDLNGSHVGVVPVALSSRDGRGVMLDTGEEHELSATLDPTGRVLGDRAPRAAALPVTVASLDSLVADGTVEPPDLIKLDVEGHETEVLRGMARQLERRPTMLVEVLTPEAAAGVEAIVRPLGYRTYRIDPEGPRRIAAVEPAPGGNLLFCSSEAAAALGL